MVLLLQQKRNGIFFLIHSGQFHGLNGSWAARNGGLGKEQPEAGVPRAGRQIPAHHLRRRGRGHGRRSRHWRELLQQGEVMESFTESVACELEATEQLIVRRSVCAGILQGEACVAASRVYLQEGIYDRFEKKLADSLKNWVVGDPFDPRVNQGPQVRAFHVLLSDKNRSLLIEKEDLPVGRGL